MIWFEDESYEICRSLIPGMLMAVDDACYKQLADDSVLWHQSVQGFEMTAIDESAAFGMVGISSVASDTIPRVSALEDPWSKIVL